MPLPASALALSSANLSFEMANADVDTSAVTKPQPRRRLSERNVFMPWGRLEETMRKMRTFSKRQILKSLKNRWMVWRSGTDIHVYPLAYAARKKRGYQLGMQQLFAVPVSTRKTNADCPARKRFLGLASDGNRCLAFSLYAIPSRFHPLSFRSE